MNYIQQAYKGENKWYLYLATFFIVVIAWQIIGSIPLLVAGVLHSQDPNEFYKAANENFLNLGINKNLFLFLMILMFIFGLIALRFCIKYIHKRSFKTLITSRDTIDWRRFWFAFILWGAIAGVFIGVGIVMSPEDYVWNFKPVPFFTLALISFVFLPFQTSFEELLFRGYLMQGIGVAAKNRWLPLIITSIIFGLLHGANPEVAKLGYISMVFYIGTGLFFGMVTLLDEGTELALGLHAINNIIAAIAVTTDWTVFQTDALFIDTSEPSVGMEMFLPVFVLYPLMLLILSKKYGWKNWRDKLVGKVKEVNPMNEVEGIDSVQF
ncbi:CPBP family intramembrane glutamic endopeptidase [Tenacibaculum sp. M341]|uniref:CPBP family intramembrane glutamic endopeptidase n=1 Tax=Tenacibaculum sp. M341 TaxID=2530339 RepID=UPI0010474E25|nr:CPBP family intramembrane glutamic endopeptidase [Tenacibaculum sp. M341]TCI90330.1 CPBP family intramembrane metalloprotease [Tenacibaculum sp. M341]